MAAKNKIKLSADPVIFIIFALITVTVYLINRYVPSLKLNTIFTTPTSVKGNLPFSFKDPLSWIRVFLYVFGTRNLSLWILLAAVKLLLPEQETNFGTGLISIMILLTVIFSGVLFACFTTTSFAGCEPVVFLLIILDFISFFKKKTLNLSSVLAAVFVCVFFFTSFASVKEALIPFFVCFAGGLCGSLVSFITMKKPAAKKKTASKKSKKDEAETVVYFDNEADSPRFKNKNNSSSDDETVVGTLTF